MEVSETLSLLKHFAVNGLKTDIELKFAHNEPEFELFWRPERVAAGGLICCKTTISLSPIPSSFRDFLSSIRGTPLKTIRISEAGNPDSTSQKALKFSNSNSSETSKLNIKSVSVETVTFIFGKFFYWIFLFAQKFSRVLYHNVLLLCQNFKRKSKQKFCLCSHKSQLICIVFKFF